MICPRSHGWKVPESGFTVMFPKPQPAFLPAHSTASPITPAHRAARSLRDPRSPRVCRGNGTPERAVMCPLLLGSHQRTEAGIQAPNSRAGLWGAAPALCQISLTGQTQSQTQSFNSLTYLLPSALDTGARGMMTAA